MSEVFLSGVYYYLLMVLGEKTAYKVMREAASLAAAFSFLMVRC